MKIIPTIGRVVWYWKEGATLPADDVTLADQPEAAHVAYVHGDSLVTLMVIGHDGRARPEQGVSLRQPDDPPWHTTPFCEWMPFQKGQAARAEQAERVRENPIGQHD